MFNEKNKNFQTFLGSAKQNKDDSENFLNFGPTRLMFLATIAFFKTQIKNLARLKDTS